jgi:hypothetical protein
MGFQEIRPQVATMSVFSGRKSYHESLQQEIQNMNPSDAFHARQMSLEAAFFGKVDAELLKNLRSELAALEEANKMAHVSGILDEKVLRDLVRVGVTAESLLAMRFVPMVHVAWADRKISPEERAAILRAAESENVLPNSPAYGVLQSWLQRSPDPAVLAAWKEYIRELARSMPSESLTELRERTKSLCYKVAQAAGGVFGIGSISQAEQEAIDECVNTWSGS